MLKVNTIIIVFIFTAVKFKLNCALNSSDKVYELNKEIERSWGGKHISYNEARFIAILRTIDQDEDYGICTGFFIAKDWVLTAAHCLTHGAQKIEVFIGTDNINDIGKAIKLSVVRVIMHSDYNHDTFENDIGLVQVDVTGSTDGSEQKEAIGAKPQTPNVEILRLNNLFWKQNEDQTSGLKFCTTIGFGKSKDKDDKLHQSSFFVEYNPNICGCLIGDPKVLCFTNFVEDDSMCPGDIGAPLIYENKAVGIGSFIFKCGEEGGGGKENTKRDVHGSGNNTNSNVNQTLTDKQLLAKHGLGKEAISYGSIRSAEFKDQRLFHYWNQTKVSARKMGKEVKCGLGVTNVFTYICPYMSWIANFVTSLDNKYCVKVELRSTASPISINLLVILASIIYHVINYYY